MRKIMIMTMVKTGRKNLTLMAANVRTAPGKKKGPAATGPVKNE